MRLSGLSIFQNEQSDFERESILRTAAVYENLQGISIDYSPQKGLYTAISYAFTDLFLLAARNMAAAWISALALPLAMYGIRWIIPATGKLSVIKYANLASLLQTNELLGIYRDLDWFGRPVSLPFVEWTAAVLFGLTFGIAFCLLFSKAQLSHSPIRGKIFPIPHKTHPVTIFQEEGKKLFWMNGAAIFLAAFFILNIYQTGISENYRDAEEIYYANYMSQLSGPWTSQNYDKILRFGEEFLPMLETQRKIAAGKLSQYALAEYAPLQQKYEVYTRIIQNNINLYLKEHPKAWLVYETGYRWLFGLNGNTDLYDPLYAGLLCAFCFSGLFAMERKSGMDVILRCTPRCRSTTVYMKLLQSGIAAVAITLVISIPHLYQILRDYGLPAMFAPAMSISDFENIPPYVTLSDLVIFWLICRFAACMEMGLISLWLGQKMGHSLTASFISATIFCLPSLLALSGMENGIEWLSFFPLFHAVSLCATQGMSVDGFPYSFAWVVWLILLITAIEIWGMSLELQND